MPKCIDVIAYKDETAIYQALITANKCRRIVLVNKIYRARRELMLFSLNEIF